jgi:hypothetical protein
VRVQQLSIFADGEELPVTFDVHDAKSITVDVEEGTRKLELKARQQHSDVPLAIQWLDWNDSIEKNEESIVCLEGGQLFEFRLNYNKDDRGRITSGLMNISYSEQRKIRAFRLGLKRYMSGRRGRQRARFLAWVPIAVQTSFLVLCLLASIFLFQMGRRPQTITTQDTNQELTAASGGAAGTQERDSSLRPQVKQNDSVTVKKKAENKASALALRHREPRAPISVTNNQQPETQVEVANVPNDATYPDDKTRAAVSMPANTRLSEVKSIYVDPSSFENQAFARTIYDLLVGNEGMTKISRLSVVKSIKESDTVLRGSVNKRDSGWEVSLRLVNRAGTVVWPGVVTVPGSDNQQVAEQAVKKLLEKLQADLNAQVPPE